jgi:hypothetical protein
MSDRVAFSGEHDAYQRLATPLVVPGSARIYETCEPAGLLYKEFPEPLGDRHLPRLRSLVEIGRLVRDGQVQRSGAQRIVWPIDLVATDGRVQGVVLPRAPAEFFRPGNGLMELAQSFSYLVGVDHPPATARLTIVGELADALDMLDRTDLIHGDISGSNVLWSGAPAPSLLVIDADGIHPVGFEVDPAHTPHWDDPRRNGEIVRHDKRSDWYALALAIYRACVLDHRADPAHDDCATVRRLPGELAGPLAQVFADPRDADARVRPAKWRGVLRAAAQDADACAAIDAAFGGPRGSVRERRGRGPAKAAGAKRVRPQPRPQQTRPVAPRPLAGTGGARRSPGGHGSADHGRRAALAVAVLIGVAAVVGIVLAVHANRIRGRHSAAADRRLIAGLPPSFRSCRSERDATAGVTAAVRCRADGQSVVVLQFSTRGQLSDYADVETVRAIAATDHETTPSICGENGGAWHYTADRSHPVGRMLFRDDGPAVEVDWTVAAERRYFAATGHDMTLGGMCRWWIDLPT